MAATLDAERPMRVVDFDGRRVFRHLPLSQLDEPVVCPEPPTEGDEVRGQRL